MRYGSVCSGIEAATMAWHPLGWTPAFFSEIEAFPSAVLAHHYGSNMPGEPLAKNGIPNHGDFTTIGDDAGPIDLLVGGTPCQSFSVAGKRLGLDDPRGNLALEYLALARRLRARWIVWENVPGVLSSHTDDEQDEADEGDDGLESADFATFLSFVQECGYGFAYRVLDAQYIRVDDFARAVPQRRRRVFLVGYLGDWRRAAAVLLEPESMRGDSAPRREAGQRAAPTIAIHPTGGGGLGTDFDLDGGLIHQAFGGGNLSGPINVSTALTAHGQRQDFEVETFVAEIASTLPAGGNSTGGERQPGMGAETAATMLIAFNSREDPEVTWDRSGALGSGSPQSQAIAFAQNTRDEVRLFGGDGQTVGALAAEPGMKQTSYVAYGLRSDASRSGEAKNPSFDANGIPRLRDAGFNFCEQHAPTIETGAPPTVAFGIDSDCFDRSGEGAGGSAGERSGLGITEGHANALRAKRPNAVATEWAVRRLMPVECERLQGFPDNFTNVPWRGKDTAPDGPRYKALGNSMACNAMRWIGQRIDIMERLIASGRISA
jgi:DNA (cytosine-5)-methyltransferase 1